MKFLSPSKLFDQIVIFTISINWGQISLYHACDSGMMHCASVNLEKKNSWQFHFIFFFLIPYVIGGRKSTDISSYENGFNKIVGKCCEICDCIRCKGCIFRQQIFFYPCYAKYYEERLMFMLC